MKTRHCEEPKATKQSQKEIASLTSFARNDKRMNSNGFLLFEVVISIVIITTALLLIMNSYSSARNSIKRSTQVIKTSLLLENKMWEFEKTDEIEEGSESGDFEEDKDYSWAINASQLEDTDFNIVRLEVFRKRDPEITRYSISTYLRKSE